MFVVYCLLKAVLTFKRLCDDIIDFGVDASGMTDLETELRKGTASLTTLYEAMHVAKAYGRWEE